MTIRASLNLLIILALLAWAALLVYTHFIPPQSVEAYATFFVMLGIALACTLSPEAYFVA